MEEQPDPPPTAVHPKHAALLHRLSHRTAATPTTTTPTQSFLTQFTTQKNSIQSSLSTAASKSDTDSISTSIESLEKSVAESSYFLPPYELRTCLNTCQTLRQTLETVSNRIAPKKRFAFKNKAKPTSISEPVSETHILDSANSSVLVPESTGFRNLENEASFENKSKPTSIPEAVIESSNLELPGSGFLVPESPGLRNLKNEVWTKEMSDGEFVLSELDLCEVRLKGSFRALFVHKLRNCKVYSGPVSGSVLIEEAEDCVFVLASHQIRIHNARRCDFYLRVRSRPIIEDCEGVRFAPYCFGYEGIESDLGEVNLDEENENWGNVDDFKWLKGFQSPNWSVLPESERIGKVTIED